LGSLFFGRLEHMEIQELIKDNLTPKEIVERATAFHTMDLQKQAVRFLFVAYGGLLASTMAVIFLQGFHFGGFQLDQTFLNWLGGATIGEVAGLAALVYGALFKNKIG
jgi:hypothetical protein